MRIAVLVVAVGLALAVGCQKPPPPSRRSIYARPAQVEMNFRGKRFILGENDSVALVRPVAWPKDRWLKLPFWLGIHVMVPGVSRPTEGKYYVISEAKLLEPLDKPGEWMIEAGSSLIKRETVFVTTRTHYRKPGKILPTIVQYVGMRKFTAPGGKTVLIPVLREVSLPMEWTLKGRVPRSYAPFRIR